MRIKIILIAFFLSAFIQPLYADEIQELKEQIKQLQSTIDTLKTKVDGLEAKQAVQSREVAELKEKPAAEGLSIEGAHVGGHFKFYLFDQVKGERNKINQSTHGSAGISAFYLYIDKDISETTTISIIPQVSVTASATPSLGSNIGRATSSSTSVSIYQAFIKTIFPNQIELRAGVFKPMFCEEYASEVWWDEQYHANKGIINIESWRDTGIELYRNFDFKIWSLPVYFYVLNGDVPNVDDNEEMSALIHFAPQVSNLKFMGSLAYGRWNTGETPTPRYATGFEWKYRKFTLRSEYMHKAYTDQALKTAGTVDTRQKGYYIKGLWRFNPKWRAVLNYSEAKIPYTQSTANRLLEDTYKATTLGLNYFFTDSSIIMGEISFVDADRSDSSEKLDYYRTTLGWRTTF